MKQNDAQKGTPSILYTDTKANIEASFATAGQTAYNTTSNEYGYYNGSAWVWGTATSMLNRSWFGI